MAIPKKEIDVDKFLSQFQRVNEKQHGQEQKITNTYAAEEFEFAYEKDVNVVIVCALDEERVQLFNAFKVPIEDRQKIMYSFLSDYNFIYHLFSYAGLNIAVVTQNNMGMAAATSYAARAILAMKPKLVAMTGICAGRKDKVVLGDIIVASQVYDYTAGKKYVDRFAPRPKPYTTSEAISNYVAAGVKGNNAIAEAIAKAWNENETPRKISIHAKAIASGTAVVDDKQTFSDAIAIQDELYGIDMEAYGIAVAANALNTEWVVIKAVQDFADGNKADDESGARSFAAFASAALLKEMLPYIVR